MRETAAPCRLLIVGGFLGAGKTTLLGAAARSLLARGLRVGMVTNDQGRSLVDTRTAATLGVPVAEVTGGCFCCRFDALLDAARDLACGASLDAVLAEPVGSCADLQATVMAPLAERAPSAFAMLPLTVVVDPAVATSALHDPGADDVAYLAGRQLAEAEVLLLNKCDVLSVTETRALASSLRRAVPGAAVMACSALAGSGVDEWLGAVWDTRAAGLPVDVDYARYGSAEAALGWLDAEGHMWAPEGLSAQSVAATLLTGLRDAVERVGGRVAHIKCAFWWASEGPGGGFTGHLVGDRRDVSFDGAAIGSLRVRADRLAVRLNARVRVAPKLLARAVAAAVEAACAACGVALAWDRLDCFQPSPPRPAYRVVPGASAACAGEGSQQ